MEKVTSKQAADQDKTVEYTVDVAREYAGEFRKKGQTVRLTPREARYYIEPLGCGLTAKGSGSDQPAGGDDAKPNTSGQGGKNDERVGGKK